MKLLRVQINKLSGWIGELGQIKVTNRCHIESRRNVDDRISTLDISNISGRDTLRITLGRIVRSCELVGTCEFKENAKGGNRCIRCYSSHYSDRPR